MTKLQRLLEDAILDGAFPGAAYYVRKNGVEETGFVGRHTYCPDSLPVDATTVWDLASLSKVVSTTTLVMLAVQRGKLDLDWPVSKVIPEFCLEDKGSITIRNLMVHNSGLIAFRPYYRTCSTRAEVLASIYAEKLIYPTGSKMVYSDLSMILVDEILTRINGLSLDQQFLEEIAKPLSLLKIGYFDLGKSTSAEEMSRDHCAPTERTEPWRRTMRRLRHGDLESVRLYGHDPDYIQGEVHDPTATAMGGVAGHAGLFSDLSCLLKFCENLCASSPKIISHDVRDMFVVKQSEQSSRALGWDTKSPTGSSAGNFMGPRSYGHTGFTGTSIWLDPDTANFGVLLTNRVHPSSDNPRLLSFRVQFYDASFG